MTPIVVTNSSPAGLVKRVRGSSSGGGAVFATNAPAGLSLIYDTDMSDLNSNGSTNGVGLGFSGNLTKTTDMTAPYGTTVLETPYVAGSLGNGVGVGSFGSVDVGTWVEIYYAQMFWVSADYSVHTTEEKCFRPGVTEGTALGGLKIAGSQTENGPEFVLLREDQVTGWTSSPSVPLRKGVWQKVEEHIRANTPGNSDGLWRAWIDGVECVNKTDMRYNASGTQMQYRFMQFDSTRGGGASNFAVPAGGQVRRFNRTAFYASSTF